MKPSDSSSSLSSCLAVVSGGRSAQEVLNAPSFCAATAACLSSSKLNSGRNFCEVVSLWLPRLAQNNLANVLNLSFHRRIDMARSVRRFPRAIASAAIRSARTDRRRSDQSQSTPASANRPVAAGFAVRELKLPASTRTKPVLPTRSTRAFCAGQTAGIKARKKDRRMNF